jgi:hypothetical protein
VVRPGSLPALSLLFRETEIIRKLEGITRLGPQVQPTHSPAHVLMVNKVVAFAFADPHPAWPCYSRPHQAGDVQRSVIPSGGPPYCNSGLVVVMDG